MPSRCFDSDHVAVTKALPVPVRSARQGGARRERNHGGPHPAGEVLLALQRHYGNHYVQRAVIQAKLVVGPPRDRYEREADRVAQAVVRGITGPGMPGVQSVGAPVRNAPVRAHGPGAADGPGASRLQQGIQQARGQGQAVPEHVRAPMEQALGADFAHVRLHTDSEADRLSHSLQARAFTSGRDIFLRRGQADLTSPAGRELIAHELTHVAQQAGSSGGEGIIQRQLWQIDPDRVYDDVLKISATRNSGIPHIFVGDTDGKDYEIDFSGTGALVPATPGFSVSSAPSGWTLAGTQGFTPPPWAPPPVEEYWKSPGHTTTYSHSPGGSAYQKGAKKQGTYGNDSNREAAGFINPKQFAVNMLPLWESALDPTDPLPSGKSNKAKVAFFKDPKRKYNVRSGPYNSTSGSYPTKAITGYQRPNGWSAVVLGHSTSAGALFNAGGHSHPPGHTVPRSDNYKFNQTIAPFHGLEDYIWSAQSGHLDPDYEQPRPHRGSHRTYWDTTAPNYTGGPWRSWNLVTPAAMTNYIDNKLAGVPIANRDIDYHAAMIESAELNKNFTKTRARELLSMIKAKGW